MGEEPLGKYDVAGTAKSSQFVPQTLMASRAMASRTARSKQLIRSGRERHVDIDNPFVRSVAYEHE